MCSKEWTGCRVTYINIRYCHETAKRVDVLKNLRAYYDKQNDELVGIEIRDAKLFLEEMLDLIALTKLKK